MVLLIDVGNTTIGIAIKNNELKEIKKIETSIFKETNEVELVSLFKDFNLGRIDKCIISSVVPSLNKKIQKIINNVFNIEPKFIDIHMKNDIEIGLINPDELGSDLYVDIYASKLYSNKAIIVDLGTAIKILTVDGDRFIGALIIPGMMPSLKSLFSNAELLSEIKIDKPHGILGNSTITCIQSGTINGTSLMIEGVVNRIIKQYGNFDVLLTGGDSYRIKDTLSIPHLYVPNLIYEGLVYLDE